MTSNELALFLAANDQAKPAVKVLEALIPQLVAFNSLLYAAMGGNHDAEEPVTQELLALAALTSDLYNLKNGLADFTKDQE